MNKKLRKHEIMVIVFIKIGADILLMNAKLVGKTKDKWDICKVWNFIFKYLLITISFLVFLSSKKELSYLFHVCGQDLVTHFQRTIWR